VQFVQISYYRRVSDILLPRKKRTKNILKTYTMGFRPYSVVLYVLCCLLDRVRTILVLGIEYRPVLGVSSSIDICPILSLYSHAILVVSDGWYNCCDMTRAVTFD